MFSRKDLFFSLITGCYAGLIAWRILVFLEKPDVWGVSLAWLAVAIPILWVLGVNLGYFLGRWMPFFNQFGKFAAIGFTNAAIDFGVLNLLIAVSGIAAGVYFSAFKSISFMAGVMHSYLWNRVWVFKSSSQNKKQEFVKFFTVILLSSLVNVGVASLVVNFVDPWFSFDEKVWANIGAIVGSAMALVFSFVGFRLIVFQKTPTQSNI